MTHDRYAHIIITRRPEIENNIPGVRACNSKITPAEVKLHCNKSTSDLATTSHQETKDAFKLSFEEN